MSLFGDYKKKVWEAYQQQRTAGKLSPNLMNPTRAGIKRECVFLYDENRHTKKDLGMFRTFFGPIADGENYRSRIERTEVDRFRPFVTYLKGRTSEPDPKNIELLAWLIQFEPRPHQFSPNAIAESAFDNNFEEGDLDEHAVPHGMEETIDSAVEASVRTKIQPGPSKKKSSSPKVWILGIIAALAIATTFYKTTEKQCMHWEYDRYRAVHCNEKLDSIKVIPLDKTALKKFRKILRPDTLTRHAVGKIWYAKVTRDSAEFYTTKGAYPLDRDKTMRPVTEYILRKYVWDR